MEHIIEKWVDLKTGKFRVTVDPFSASGEPGDISSQFLADWFDDAGDLTSAVSQELQRLLSKNNNVWCADNDVCAVLAANLLAANTRGSYSTIYYWR